MYHPDEWLILVADDDFDMLAVTELALMGLSVHGVPVRCVTVQSAAEARQAMATNRFAVALIDVVMETDDAGLELVRWMRANPALRATRIVIRTGQPGRAPEQQLLNDYDINDYWPKTEVGAKRSRAILAGLIRSFRDIVELELRSQELGEQKQELMAARDAAERANSAKTSFLASVNHELRTPLSAILGLSELALEACKEPGTVELLSSLHLNARALHGLVSDVLDLSRIESGMLAVIETPLRLRRIVEEVADLHAALASRRQLEVQARVDPRIPTWLEGDPDRIQQLLMNLVGNAVKYTISGTVRVEARLVEVIEEHNTVRIELRVADTGRGVPPAELRSLVGRLVEGKEPPLRSGSRLGLGIASRLIGHMGGHWSVVQSLYGVGSTFGVQLGLKRIADVTGGGPPRELRGMRVGLQIANAALRQDTAELLEMTGIHIDSDDPQVVVTDMPEVTLPDSLYLRPAGNTGPGIALPLVSDRIWNALVSRVSSEHTEGDNEPAPLSPLRILLVDDDPSNLQVLSTRLRRDGMSVTTAETGEEAVELFVPGRFDLILMDIVLPGISGWDAARRIRGIERSMGTVEPVRMAALSAHATPEAEARAAREGFVEFLPRPVPARRLHKLLEDCPLPSDAKPRILLVEDSPVLRMLFVQYLKAQGIDYIREADDGETGLQLADGVDLIMMDVDLPGIDGLEATRRLRARGCKAVINVISAYDDPDLGKRATDAGADAVLRKPVGRTDLEAMIERWRTMCRR